MKSSPTLVYRQASLPAADQLALRPRNSPRATESLGRLAQTLGQTEEAATHKCTDAPVHLTGWSGATRSRCIAARSTGCSCASRAQGLLHLAEDIHTPARRGAASEVASGMFPGGSGMFPGGTVGQ